MKLYLLKFFFADMVSLWEPLCLSPNKSRGKPPNLSHLMWRWRQTEKDTAKALVASSLNLTHFPTFPPLLHFEQLSFSLLHSGLNFLEKLYKKLENTTHFREIILQQKYTFQAFNHLQNDSINDYTMYHSILAHCTYLLILCAAVRLNFDIFVVEEKQCGFSFL